MEKCRYICSLHLWIFLEEHRLVKIRHRNSFCSLYQPCHSLEPSLDADYLFVIPLQYFADWCSEEDVSPDHVGAPSVDHLRGINAIMFAF